MLLQRARRRRRASCTRRPGSARRDPRRFQPDVVLLDIGMPGMDGYEVARRIRASAADAATSLLIALTGWGQEEDRRLAERPASITTSSSRRTSTISSS